MFDMGFTELMLIGIVSLVIIGPERLPGVARTAGKYFGKLRRFVTTIKADVESELRADELREILNKQRDELQSLKKVVEDVGKDVGESVNQVRDSVSQSMNKDESDTVETAASWTDTITPPVESIVDESKVVVDTPAIDSLPKEKTAKPKAKSRAKPKTKPKASPKAKSSVKSTAKPKPKKQPNDE